MLSEEQERFRRANNDWYDAAYRDPSTVDPAVYDPEVNPGAVAWFKVTATHLIERVDGCLAILAAHGVPVECVRSADPGRGSTRTSGRSSSCRARSPLTLRGAAGAGPPPGGCRRPGIAPSRTEAAPASV